MGDQSILSLRGGLNDFDPPSRLAPDECQTATNVDFWKAPCGERRAGYIALTTQPTWGASAIPAMMARHLPTINESDMQLWVLQIIGSTSATFFWKDTTWHTITGPVAGVSCTFPDFSTNLLYHASAQTAHGKLFLLYNPQGSVEDRMHLYDAAQPTYGATVRRAGIAGPPAPTGITNTGVAGTFSGTRYYRYRLVTMSGGGVVGTAIRRSEPSGFTAFAPDGAHTGAIIPFAPTSNDGETAWELEASTDSFNFYRIALTGLGSNATDTQAFNLGYSVLGPLSDTIGNYALIPAARFCVMDVDRLIFAGHFFNASLASHIWWTPVAADPTGVGNDERIPVATGNELDLDGYEGGPITGIEGPVNGTIYVFKLSQIYKLVRTGKVSNAYIPVAISKTVGAVLGSITRGVDETGAACVYFVDPRIGFCRLGGDGLRWCGRYVWNTFQRFNVDATVPARVVYYPNRQQVRWTLSVDGANFPSLGFILQANNTRTDSDSVKRGWSIWNGAAETSFSRCLFSSNIDAGVARSLKLVPFYGVPGPAIWRGDTGTTDNGTVYTTDVITAPFSITGQGQIDLLSRFGVRAGSISGATNVSSTIQIRLIRNFGVEFSAYKLVTFTPINLETESIKPIDDLSLSECFACQVEFGDTGFPWSINEIMLKTRPEETA